MELSLQVFAALGFWVAMSSGMILFNAALLKDFRHPAWLTFWHQSVSGLLAVALRCMMPSLVSTKEMSLLGALKIAVPVSLAHCLNMIAGNTAMMYISVSFCQMIKAWAPVCVYTMGILLGTHRWCFATAKTLVIITLGLTLTSLGELKVSVYGFIMQMIALVSDGVRVNLLEILLSSAGYKLNPLSSVLIFAPVSSCFLLLTAWLSDTSISLEAIHRIGEGTLVVNAAIAFLLNFSVYIALQVSSGLIFALAGIVKDICIIAGSVLIFGSPVSGLQLIGYTVAVLGIQLYGRVSRSPELFEDGLVRGVYIELTTQGSSIEREPCVVAEAVGKRAENEEDEDGKQLQEE